MTTMFAHQGGWDELLYAAVPIVLIFLLLRVANSRAKKLSSSSEVSSTTKQGESD